MAKQLTIDDVRKATEEAITAGEYSIAKIAASLNMSERTFCQRMKELIDITPRVFISDIQMKRCARLLLEFPDKPLREIAQADCRMPSSVLTAIIPLHTVRSIGRILEEIRQKRSIYRINDGQYSLCLIIT